jgi:hypothetical protein
MNARWQMEQQMKTNLSNLNCPPTKMCSQRKSMTFGDFVTGVYDTWGKRKAKGIIQLAIKMNVVEFRGEDRFVVS